MDDSLVPQVLLLSMGLLKILEDIHIITLLFQEATQKLSLVR
jgi:hypothetical protein